MLQSVEDVPISHRTVADYTKKDAVLDEVLSCVRDGWDGSSRQGQSDTLEPFTNEQTEIWCDVSACGMYNAKVRRQPWQQRDSCDSYPGGYDLL